MSRPHPSSANRLYARRGGVMQFEILITLFLTVMVAGFATQIVMRVLDTDRLLADVERSDTALDRAVQRLRHDTERAATVTAGNSALTLGTVIWAAEQNALLRREGESTDRFESLRGTPYLESNDGVVTLAVAGRTWAFRPLTDRGTLP